MYWLYRMSQSFVSWIPTQLFNGESVRTYKSHPKRPSELLTVRQISSRLGIDQRLAAKSLRSAYAKLGIPLTTHKDTIKQFEICVLARLEKLAWIDPMLPKSIECQVARGDFQP